MLGSRKLLIALCMLPCILSLVCIGAFAAPAEDFTSSVDVPFDTDVVEDVVRSPSALPVETFPAQPLLESSYYSITFPFSALPRSSGVGISCDTVSLYRSYEGNITFEFGSDVGSGKVVWRQSIDNVWYVCVGDSSSYISFPFYEPYSTDASYLVIKTGASSITLGGNTYDGVLVENSLITDISDSVFSVGDALLTFVMSSWVVLLPLAAWLVILCIGAIRKLVKGV